MKAGQAKCRHDNISVERAGRAFLSKQGPGVRQLTPSIPNSVPHLGLKPKSRCSWGGPCGGESATALLRPRHFATKMKRNEGALSSASNFGRRQ